MRLVLNSASDCKINEVGGQHFHRLFIYQATEWPGYISTTWPTITNCSFSHACMREA